MNRPATADQIITTASQTMRGFVPSSFSLAVASEQADQAWAAQWRAHSHRSPPNGGWDWPALRKVAGKEPSSLVTAMWCRQETELCGLSLMTLNRTACQLCMVEGSPNPHHLVKGMVLLIALELASMWAQGSGRREVWVLGPMSDMILHHLLQDYGFELKVPLKGVAFCRKAV